MQMRPTFVRSALIAILCVTALRAETLDRIAVTIGSHVIAESEVIRYIRIAAFLDGKPPDLSARGRRDSARRLVDQYLVLQDALLTRATLPGPADVEAVMNPVRALYGNAEDYQKALKAAGLTEDELKTHLLTGLRTLRYTDVRFRPEVQLTEEDLRARYATLPERERATRSFEESREDLEDLLAGERVMGALDRWLEMTRHDVPIIYRDVVFQ